MEELLTVRLNNTPARDFACRPLIHPMIYLNETRQALQIPFKLFGMHYVAH